ncbi:hypothetical protein [Bacillus coahuilensis]|uniref:hypothetical protein n=1 Tax=Bacillus coahuilensis TaxID=408580 RepID=UPI0001851094|nr:hypothetical protein [Bacillus coahuilensis]
MMKYKKHLIHSIEQKIDEWEALNLISHSDLIQYLQTLISSSTVLGLIDIEKQSKDYLEVILSEEAKDYSYTSIYPFLEEQLQTLSNLSSDDIQLSLSKKNRRRRLAHTHGDRS